MDDAITCLGEFCHDTPERAHAFTATELTFDWDALASVMTLKYFLSFDFICIFGGRIFRSALGFAT